MRYTLRLLLLLFIFQSCDSKAQKKEDMPTETSFEIQKTDAEWKEVLTPEQYYVLRQAGTERPFSSQLNNVKEPGYFVCAACQNPLYETKHKFDSGTGWPSFDRAVEGSLATSYDHKLGYKRDEALCGKCGGHLGHIFNDGPRNTTGMRHCINGDAMLFVTYEEFNQNNDD
jgi:peptide-methionine (R)-S-oxide reductase